MNSKLTSAFCLIALSAHLCALADGAIPRPDKVVIVFDENQSYSGVIGNPSSPYTNFLAQNGANFTNSHAETHPSQPNYIAFFSGDLQGVSGNSVFPHSQFVAPNLGSKLIEQGRTFIGYADSLPFVGYDGTTDAEFWPYVRRHNPWVNWQDDNAPAPGQPNPQGKLSPQVNRPFTEFPTAPGSDFSILPDVSIVIPNENNDGHNTGAAFADSWLQQNLSAYASWAQAHNSLLIVTWDEGGADIPTVFYGPMIKTGNYDMFINHYNVLRTLEDMYGLAHHGNTISAEPITAVFVPEPHTFAIVMVGAACLVGAAGMRPAARRVQRTAVSQCNCYNKTKNRVD